MTELFTILKAVERFATEILIGKNQTNSMGGRLPGATAVLAI